MLNAASIAKSMNIPVVTFSGFLSSNPLRSMGKLNFWVDSDQYNIVEMTHHIWLLAVVDNLVELKNA
jgi:D-sedoheptulose 7-phosphate isomerase